MDGTIGLNVEGELLIVGALLDAVVARLVLDVDDGRMDRVDGDDTDGVGGALVLISRHIAAALVDGQGDVQLGLRLHVANLQVGVEYLETVEIAVEVTGFEDCLVFDREREFLMVVFFQLATEADLLESQDDVGHVLDNSGERRELMVDTVDLDRRDSIAFERREKEATQSVADGCAVAGLQRTEFESAAEVVSLEHDHLIGFLK